MITNGTNSTKPISKARLRSEIVKAGVDVVTAVAATETQLQTAIAARDQVISAYQEILRMPT